MVAHGAKLLKASHPLVNTQPNTIMLLTDQQLLDHARHLAHTDPTLGVKLNDAYT